MSERVDESPVRGSESRSTLLLSEVERLRAVEVAAVALLRTADDLYSNYGLVAGQYGNCGKWICDVRDFLRAVEPASLGGGIHVSEWRPIETAPKDGTFVDLWAGDRIHDCFWCSKRGLWVQFQDDSYQAELREEPITHWLPLPAPPGEGE